MLEFPVGAEVKISGWSAQDYPGCECKILHCWGTQRLVYIKHPSGQEEVDLFDVVELETV